jgi:phospholipase C
MFDSLNFNQLKTSAAPRRTMALLLALTTALGPTAVPAFAVSKPVAKVAKAAPVTATPIQHLVVIFQENVSFDHYFGTYPRATNPPGEPKFTAAPNTPTVNGLTNALLSFNPNLNPANGAERSQAVTSDQDHNTPLNNKRLMLD